MELAECRAQVQQFAILMEEVLRQNDHKDGWMGMSDLAIMERIHEEVYELDDEVIRPIGSIIKHVAIKEAVDVANFCMFLADIYGGLDNRRYSGEKPELVKEWEG